MRLIDADLLLETMGIKGATKYGNKNVEQRDMSYSTLMMYEIADYIEDAPTIEPVKGKWIYKSYSMECSMCDAVFERYDNGGCDNKFNFCPNCGADMRGTDIDVGSKED